MDEKSTIPPRIYPSAPLEEVISPSDDQYQALLPPAPPPTYNQATGAAPAAIDITQVIITPGPPILFGPRPVDLLCPYCRNYTRTRTRRQPSSRTHFIALVLCLFQMYCCMCLPYCIDSCMNTAHYCGLCDHYLGTFVRE